MSHHLTLFLCLIGIALSAFTQNKLALLVAVGKYPDTSNLRPIASVNDLKYIKAAAVKAEENWIVTVHFTIKKEN